MKLRWVFGFAAAFAFTEAQAVPQIGMAADWPSSPPVISGRASFYGERFSGRKTASGETFDHQTISAASNRFPLGTLVAVRRVFSARCVLVRINDRMGHRSRLIDLSRRAAVELGMIEAGITDVEVVPVPKSLRGHENACKLSFMPPVHLHAGTGLNGNGERRGD